MNFKQWYNNLSNQGLKFNPDMFFSSEMGWNSCKKEVTKLLTEKDITHKNPEFTKIKGELLREMEKL